MALCYQLMQSNKELKDKLQKKSEACDALMQEVAEARAETLLVKDEVFQDARQEIIRWQAMESEPDIRMSQLQEQLLQSQNDH